MSLPDFMRPDPTPGSVIVLGLVGKKNSGKTTTAKIIMDHYPTDTGKLGFKEIAFATPVKKITEIVYGFEYDMLLGDTPEKRMKRDTLKDPIWNKSPVQAMQYLGTELFRDNFDKEVWIKIAKREIDEYTRIGQNVIITDCRFPNEIEFVRSQPGGRILVIYENPDDLVPRSPGIPGETSIWKKHAFAILIMVLFITLIVILTQPNIKGIIISLVTICVLLTSIFLMEMFHPIRTPSQVGSIKNHASETSFQSAIRPSDFYYHNKKDGIEKMTRDILNMLPNMK